MSKFDKIYNAIAFGKTLLGIGPMSFNCVNATIEVAQDHDIPIKLIASRRQVESEKFGGGYVTTTEELSRHVKLADTKDNIFLARDHGGPYQGSDEKYLSYEAAMVRAYESYLADIQSGFDILHIDPSLQKKQLKEIIDDVVRLYKFCTTAANAMDKEIIFECGTEEHSGNISTIENFNFFTQEIKEKCPKVKFVVGNMGLWVKELENVGQFNEEQAKKFVEICNSRGLYLKGHNSDYVSSDVLKQHPRIGVHSINIAPAYGVRETQELLFLFDFYGLQKEREEFIQLAVKSNKWHKWMKDSKQTHSDEYKAQICGHYIFEYLRVKEIKTKLREKCDLDKLLKDSVKDLIKEHLFCLGWGKELGLL